MLRLAGGRLSLQSSALRRFVDAPRTVSSTAVSLQKQEKATDKKTPPPLGIPYSKLTVGVPKETFPLEKRVAATPESVARLIKPGFNVAVETGAGAASFYSDADYLSVGATIVPNVYKESDIILKVSVLYTQSIPVQSLLYTTVLVALVVYYCRCCPLKC
jgi:hypothetical protein